MDVTGDYTAQNPQRSALPWVSNFTSPQWQFLVLCCRLIVGVNGGRAATPGLPQLIFMGIAPKKSRLPMSTPQWRRIA